MSSDEGFNISLLKRLVKTINWHCDKVDKCTINFNQLDSDEEDDILHVMRWINDYEKDLDRFGDYYFTFLKYTSLMDGNTLEIKLINKTIDSDDEEDIIEGYILRIIDIPLIDD